MHEDWKAAIEELRLKTPSTFDRWFSAVQFDDLTDGILQLRAQNLFVRDFVSDHYLPVVKDRLRERTGLHIEVVWTIDPQLAHPVAQKQVSVPPPSQIESRSDIAPTSAGIDSSRSESRQEPTQSSDEGGLTGNLNPKYLFANFVVGTSNELAHAASLAGAGAGAGTVHRSNPLFICGGTGLGKTHLLHAIGHHILATRPSARVVVVSAEAFTNEFIAALAAREMDAFRARYRMHCDLLLMDDVHNLAGKEGTQEEFFHTFNALHLADRQIVLTSDHYPHELERMTKRLVTRFEWGLVADVQAPQLETRVAIVRKKAQLEQLEMDDDVALLLAQSIRSNVRELEGALIRLAAQASILHRKIDVEFTRSVLAQTLQARQTPVSVDDVIRAVGHHFNIRSTDLTGKDRTRSIAQARHVAIYLCRQRLNYSYPELGRHFGHRDHTSVMHAVKKVEAQRETDVALRNHLDAIERKLG